MKKPISCRLMIPDGDGFREWNELTGEEKEAFGKRGAERTGKALNERLGRKEYEKL